MIFYTVQNTPAGEVMLVGDGETLSGLYWKVFKRIPKINPEWVEDETQFKDVLAELDEYFNGRRNEFSVKTDLQGTEFQKKVWSELAKIPYGKTTTYQTIATAIGSPKAVRAVGTAVGSNPVSIIVPCHRVLTSGNGISGYAGGVPAKRLLLQSESIVWNE